VSASVEPVWLTVARRDIGLAEIPGKQHAPRIVTWLKQLGAWWSDDETPWCGVALAAWMRESGIALPKHWYRAKAWLDWGTALNVPVLGCVVVFERTGGGHVGLVVGYDRTNNLLVLGGNQNNRVSIAAFSRARVAGYRWPAGQALGELALPLIDGVEASTSEA
jgi:uncharacterized protein (TIGR02594 family)